MNSTKELRSAKETSWRTITGCLQGVLWKSKNHQTTFTCKHKLHNFRDDSPSATHENMNYTRRELLYELLDFYHHRLVSRQRNHLGLEGFRTPRLYCSGNCSIEDKNAACRETLSPPPVKYGQEDNFRFEIKYVKTSELSKIINHNKIH